MPEEESFLEIAKKLKLTIPFLIIGIAGALYIGLMQVKPVIDSIQQLKNDVAQQTNVLATKQKEYDDLKLKLKKQQEESVLEKAVFVPEEKGLPPEDMIAGEFAEILEIMRANTIKTRSIKFDYNPKSDKFVDRVPEKFNVAALEMDMISTYKNFENFLKDLYKHEHFLEISSVEVVEPYQKDKKILMIKFKMKLYAQKS